MLKKYFLKPLLLAAFSQATPALIADDASADNSTEMSTTAKAPLQQIFPNSYSSLELRHYLDQSAEKGSVTKLQARYKLGSSFFDEKLDTTLTFSGENYLTTANDENPTILKGRATELYLGYKLYKSSFVNETVSVKLSPYGAFQLPRGDKGLTGTAGLTLPVSYTQPIKGGTLEFGVSYDIAMTLGSRLGKAVPVENADGTLATENSLDNEERRQALGLTVDQDKNLEAHQTASTLIETRSARASFSPTASYLKDLEFSVGAELSTTFTPKMVLNEAQDKVEVKREGAFNRVVYNPKRSLDSSIKVSYELKKGLKVSNTYLTHPSKDGARQYTNVLGVAVDLF